MQKVLYILFLLTLSSCSSSKEERVYTPIDMYMMAFNFDKTIEEVRVTDPTLSVKCSSYPEGCITGSPKRFKIRLVEMIVAQFFKESQACLAALKLNEYYSRNWLFDDVMKEPVLKSFIIKVYDAKNPKTEGDCI